jgi:hypothetical protein
LSQKRIFKANSWLVPSSDNEDAKAFMIKKGQENPPNQLIRNCSSEFSPSNFLVPGWSGEGIISKDALGLKNNLQALVSSATKQFTNVNSNKTLKRLIYSEFLSYAQEHNLHLEELDNPANFWYHLQRKSSPHKQILKEFNEIYCFRAVTVYLFKIRFILILNEELGNQISETSIMNPNSYLHRVFKKGSSKELHADCLKLNEYSWYRPETNDKEIIQQLMIQLPNVSVTEIIKICSQDSHSFRDKSKLDFKDSEYSHSLSHKSFGLFINKLLANFPFWLDGTTSNKREHKKDLNVLNTKFMGNSLTSLSLSHCLAQEYNSFKHWSKIISPDFEGAKFNNGNFLKFCHELQFITFLVQLAKKQELDALDLLCHVMNEKHTKMFQRNDQMSIFMDLGEENNPQYDRIVINLNQLQKKNPHHALCNSIYAEYSNLNRNGYLFVMSNQRFFVPSQSEKVESVLKKFDLKATIDLENLHGRGEVGNHIFIFKKKEENEKTGFDMNAILMGPAVTKVRKASCLTMTWRGKLSQFNNFEILVNELSAIIDEKTITDTPLYQKELDHGLSFEFHQDVIVNGKLLSSTSQDPKKITHPNFFKNLTKSCMPLSTFFNIESITGSAPTKNKFTNNFLGIPTCKDALYPLILVVDYRSPTQTKLIITSSDSYQGMIEKFGHAYYQYFGLTPKIENINYNIFREFFATPIGTQLIQLSLGGSSVKTKAKLNSLLIPKFFTEAKPLPNHLENQLVFLNANDKKIMSFHPDKIRNEFNQVKDNLLNLSTRYPWQCLSRLSLFKFNLEACLKKFAYDRSKGSLIVDYNNPLIREPLLKLKSYPLLPKHEDIFVEFMFSKPDDIHNSLEKAKIKFEKEQYCLELYSEAKLIIKFYSEKNLLKFMKFILSKFQNVPISQIIQSFKVPKLSEFNPVIEEYTVLQSILEEIDTNARRQMTDLITQQISSSSKF